MIAVDTNVLIYAHRAETEHHAPATEALRGLAEGERPFGLPVFCVAEFVRVVTHRRVFSPPSRLATALAFLDRLNESPVLRLLLPGADFPRHFREVCEQARVRGNQVFDAQIAAVCREHGVREILTADRGFARFEGVNPHFL